MFDEAMVNNQIKNEILSKYYHIKEIIYSESLDSLLNECNQYISLYKTLCEQIFSLKNPFLSGKVQIAEAIYYTSLSDYAKKIKNHSYYRGNCSAFSIIFHDLLCRIQGGGVLDSTSSKLKGLLLKCMRDSLRLIDHYQASVNGEELFKIDFQSKNPDFSLFYDTCSQIIFGESRFDDCSDQSEVTPTLIRVMIELRFKWSMGISGYTVNQKPGNMNGFLEVYNSFLKTEKVVVFPRFDIIRRIYAWGNIYVHTGIRSYAWLTGFAVLILDSFFYGKDESHRLSGVKVESLSIIYEFWDALKAHYSSRSNEKEVVVGIVPYKPGFICTDKECRPIECKNHYAIYEDEMLKLKVGRDTVSRDTAIYNIKCILEEGKNLIGNSLYERVRSSYISLREQEIRERAYYLWLQRGTPLWDASSDWYLAIRNDIIFLPEPA